MTVARGSVVWFVDDDDQVLPGAVAAIKQAFEIEMRPTVFRMIHLGSILPRNQEIALGNMGTPMVVVPRTMETPKFPVPFENGLHSDFEWIQSVHQWQAVSYSDAVIYSVSTIGEGK